MVCATAGLVHEHVTSGFSGNLGWRSGSSISMGPNPNLASPGFGCRLQQCVEAVRGFAAHWSGSVQETISNLSEQEHVLKQEVAEAQTQQESEDRRQQQLQEQRAKALEEEDRIAAELASSEASIAQLRNQMQQVPVLSDVSHSEEEDPDISSSDGSESQPDSDNAAAALQNGHADHLPGATPNGTVAGAGAGGKQLSLTRMLQELRSDNKQPVGLGLASLTMTDQLEALAKKVCAPLILAQTAFVPDLVFPCFPSAVSDTQLFPRFHLKQVPQLSRKKGNGMRSPCTLKQPRACCPTAPTSDPANFSNLGRGVPPAPTHMLSQPVSIPFLDCRAKWFACLYLHVRCHCTSVAGSCACQVVAACTFRLYKALWRHHSL